jgi:hypothetical protein
MRSVRAHEPHEGVQEALIILVRLANSLAFTLQDVDEDTPQLLIPIEHQYPSQRCFLAT